MEQKDLEGAISKTESFNLIIEELSRVSTEDGGFTIVEMAEAVGRCTTWCRVKMGALIRNGKAEHAGHRSIIDISGRRSRTPIYRMVV